MSFSNSGGGAIALPSPTHAHQMDVTSAVRSLRRSISRSPSKFLSRTSSQSSDGSQQATPTRESPCRRVASTPQLQLQSQQHNSFHVHSAPPATLLMRPSTPHQLPPQTPSAQSHPGWRSQALSQSPSLSPFRSNLRLSVRSAKSSKTSTPSRPLARARASPKSPLKRPLYNAFDSSNTNQASTTSPLRCSGQENTKVTNPSPALRRSTDKSSRHSLHLDISGSTQFEFLTALDASSDCRMVPAAGALKRSDAIMNLEHPTQGSPVAKRRSLHGISSLGSAEDLNIFTSNMKNQPAFEIHEDSNPEYELATSDGSSHLDALQSPTPSASNVPKRSSSLRKSTLQQRHGDRTSFGRRTGEKHLAQLSADTFTPVRLRPRLSTEHFIPLPESRESCLFSATQHQMETKCHQPHPLSKTLTTSSSGGSLEEEKPVYGPTKVVETSKPHPFSRSLPLDVSRPTHRPDNDLPRTVATPNHASQLWIPAFNSTGLISKVNRHPEDEMDKKAPDTPCKKSASPFATFPPLFGSALKKTNKSRNSFSGIAATFNPTHRPTPTSLGGSGKGLSIFQPRNTRRGSILSLDGDELKMVGDPGEVPVSSDSREPPTPTKNIAPSSTNPGEESLASPTANRSIDAPLSAVRSSSRKESRKSRHNCMTGLQGSSDCLVSPDMARAVDSNRETDLVSLQRFPVGHSDTLEESQLQTLPETSVPSETSRNVFAKLDSVTAASPVDGPKTPQTPHERFLPLGTSRLSISQANESWAENGMLPPATPNADRDFRSSTSIFVTPVNCRNRTVDIDASLYSKFDEVEQIGTGEFSTVYRVKLKYSSAFNSGTTTPGFDPAVGSPHGSTYAVKKSKRAYVGQLDRENKLREVKILQSLSHAEHVVHYVDSWEHNYHLYIQTEFCEEGTLDKFLGKVGHTGRLEDFRIYKILLDLCLVRRDFHWSACAQHSETNCVAGTPRDS